MRIDIRMSGRYAIVTVCSEYTTIDLGLLDEGERKALAQEFTDAAEKLLEGIKDETT